MAASVQDLSPAKCLLLASSLAAEGNIKGLYQLTPVRQDVFDITLILRILLTYLPETLKPSVYITYLHETATRIYLEQHDEYHLDLSSVRDVSQEEAERRLRHTKLAPLEHPLIAENSLKDPLVIFLICRAHTIDTQTGLIPFLPELLEPFLDRSMFLRNWYISTILPLVRLDYQYYPDEDPTASLAQFEQFAGEQGIHKLLVKTERSARNRTATTETMGRDFRGVLGPWIHGSMQRKKRKLNGEHPIQQMLIGETHEQQSEQDEITDNADKIRDWQAAFRWILTQAVNDFKTAVQVIEGWGGPSDVDFGGHRRGRRIEEKEESLASELLNEYSKIAFACIYINEEEETRQVIDLAHAVLVRLADLFQFEPPPDLATSIHLLPKIQEQAASLEDHVSPDVLRFDALLDSDNPLTKPVLESFSLLQMLVYSAYQFIGLGHNIPVSRVTKLRFFSDEIEQLKVLQRILHGLVNGPRRDEEQWNDYRDTCLWLWDWAIQDHPDTDKQGCGPFGKILRNVVETELLDAMCRVGHYGLVGKIYIDSPPSSLTLEDVGKTITNLILQYFDNASNGNRTRGGAKKASELLTTFRPHFPDSQDFRRCAALLSSAHALSFYSLTLQRGVPFQPVSIRVNSEPLSLIEKVLAQNQRSYTKLDDLVEIGRNVTIAHFGQSQANGAVSLLAAGQDEASQLRNAERRIIAMAISAALAEDDFETAYSYVVNRLSPSLPTPSTSDTSVTTGISNSSPLNYPTHDDISWRAALEAGRHRSAILSTHNTSASSSTNPQLRRLEQRMELLSHALLLAPSTSLTEVLAAWRRCEEELLSLLATESAADHAHNLQVESDAHARGGNDFAVPGGFGAGLPLGLEPGFAIQPKRKEMGRGAVEEAPMGLFDVARGAAAALGRSAGGLGLAEKAEKLRQQGLRTASGTPIGNLYAQAQAQAHGLGQGLGQLQGQIQAQGYGQGYGVDGGEGEGRVRKRDMVANAVTGGLVSGIGWVLGANPGAVERPRSSGG